MITGLQHFTPRPDHRKSFNEGFEEAVGQFEKMVKKMGKKYHKEFLYNLKNMDNGRYVNATSTISTHKCDCRFCEINTTYENN